MKKPSESTNGPDGAVYAKYYEHDGMLRAYANRSMLLAVIFGATALASLGFAIYVRLQPPTVIRVDKEGNATVVGAARQGPSRVFSLSADAAAEAAPTELEGRAVVKHFLERYLSYTPDSVARNLSEALNLMTQNLRTYTLNQLRDSDTMGKIEEDHIICDFEIKSIEHVKTTPWTYVAFGVKEVHQVRKGTEVTDRIVARYTVRLVEDRRTDDNPSGLLVGEYKEQQMVGDRETGLEQHSTLESPSPDAQP
jgi:type IV secretory pathway TrbF-like protein